MMMPPRQEMTLFHCFVLSQKGNWVEKRRARARFAFTRSYVRTSHVAEEGEVGNERRRGDQSEDGRESADADGRTSRQPRQMMMAKEEDYS